MLNNDEIKNQFEKLREELADDISTEGMSKKIVIDSTLKYMDINLMDVPGKISDISKELREKGFLIVADAYEKTMASFMISMLSGRNDPSIFLTILSAFDSVINAFHADLERMEVVLPEVSDNDIDMESLFGDGEI